MTWRNPWPRVLVCPTGHPDAGQNITGELHVEETEEVWEELSEDAAKCDDTGRAALRVRAAARHSCARLRRERDRARAAVCSPAQAEEILRSEFAPLLDVLGGSVALLVRQAAARVVRRVVGAALSEPALSAGLSASLSALAPDLRELAARRAVDGWIRGSAWRYVATVPSGDVRAYYQRDPWVLVATATTYPALADALCPGWEKNDA